MRPSKIFAPLFERDRNHFTLVACSVDWIKGNISNCIYYDSLGFEHPNRRLVPQDSWDFFISILSLLELDVSDIHYESVIDPKQENKVDCGVRH